MNAITFKPAASYTQRHGIFVALTGGTNSGKSYSALRLARGIAGPKGKVAAADTEGGRLLHLRKDFDFDLMMVDPPHRPEKYASVARAAEEAGYDALVIDSFSMEWAGMGGVLDWQAGELDRMAGEDYGKRERMKMASWIKPKMAHKAMVYSFLQRRIPIIFAIRGEESVKPGEKPGDKPTKIFKAICNSAFNFEVTVSFRLATDNKGVIDLSDPLSFKMEGSHRDIFQHGEQLSERHGEMLATWASGAPMPESTATMPPKLRQMLDTMATEIAAAEDMVGLGVWQSKTRATQLAYLADKQPAEHARILAAVEARATALQSTGDGMLV